MPFKKGQSGNPAGKPVGIERKIVNAAKIMHENHFCPILHAIYLFHDQDTKIKEKVEILKMLADKYAPNLKALEIKGEIANNYVLNVLLGKQMPGVVIEHDAAVATAKALSDLADDASQDDRKWSIELPSFAKKP